MRMLPATANAMMRMLISQTVVQSSSSSWAGHSFALLLYTGVPPTKEELDAHGNGATTQNAGNNSIYTNMQAFLAARTADYVGGIAGTKPVMQLVGQNVPILTAAAMNAKFLAANNDNRTCYILRDAVPTWFLLIGSQTQLINISTGLEAGASLDSLVVCGTVGDENSNADLRLVGGEVFANNTTPNDQSKAVVLSDLILKFA